MKIDSTKELDIDSEIEQDSSNLPDIISNQIDKLNRLDKKIKILFEKGKKAEKAAKNANQKISFLSGKKIAIEQLQSSNKETSEAIQELIDSQNLSFELHSEIGKVTKFLFFLGASNIAQSRIIVRELEMKIKGASEKEVSDLAKKELLLVIKQLKVQEDLENKLEKLTYKLNTQLKRLDEQERNTKILDKKTYTLQLTSIGLLILILLVIFLIT